MKAYEAMFIFPSILNEEMLNKALQRINDEITKLNGTIKETEIKGKRVFARPMKKQQEGQYVIMRFDIGSADIANLLARFKLNTDIFRVQIVTEPREKNKKDAVKEDSKEVHSNG